jgi:hypothetical protein
MAVEDEGSTPGVRFASTIAWVGAGGLIGLIVGGILGRLSETPNEFLGSLDVVGGALVGGPIGAIAGLMVGLAAAARSRKKGRAEETRPDVTP